MCIYKWIIPIEQFDLDSDDDLQMLRACGMELNFNDQTALVRLVLAVDDPFTRLDQRTRVAVADTIGYLTSIIKDTSLLRKIIDTVVMAIKHIEPVGPIIRFNNPTRFEQELEFEFMNKLREIAESSLESYDRHMPFSKSMGPIAKMMVDSLMKPNFSNTERDETMNNSKSTRKLKFYDPSKILSNIREVDKIVSYHDNDWKVKYSVSMNPDETYTHKIDVCDFNDHDNKTSIEIKTDSHFIKALDERIKTVIEELEQNLWTIDRFAKWSGDLNS